MQISDLKSLKLVDPGGAKVNPLSALRNGDYSKVSLDEI